MSFTAKLQFLNIVTYTKNIEYDKMYKRLSRFYNIFSNVDTLFVIYDPLLNTDQLLVGDILFLKGEGTIVPGILRKTIDAFLLREEKISTYNFIVRTNISTVINFFALERVILKSNIINIDYLSAFINNLSWLDPSSGIFDNSYHGLRYGSGIMILMSPYLVKSILNKRHYLNFNVVDDIAFGLFMKEHFPNIILYEISQYVFSNHEDIDFITKIKYIKYSCENPDTILWRNKSNNRAVDAQCLNYICDLVIKNEGFNVLI
jgi:hypothetical protein